MFWLLPFFLAGAASSGDSFNFRLAAGAFSFATTLAVFDDPGVVLTSIRRNGWTAVGSIAGTDFVADAFGVTFGCGF